MVVHPRAHKLPEGVVRPLPDPAVNRHALRPEADGLGLEIALLDEQRQRWRALAEAATFTWIKPLQDPGRLPPRP